MPDPSPRPPAIRFGVFEVDLRSGELRRNGLKIRLQEQPFQILAMLLERPGEMVTREEIQKKLWSEDTFVDFEHSLATAVKKLREALGDSADNPRFVETLPRRGYRFIAPVHSVLPVSSPAVGAAMSTSPLQRVALAGLAVIAVAGVGVAWWLTRSPRPAPVPTLTRLTSDSGLTTDPALSPDGKLLAYASDRAGEGNLDIYMKQVGGGEPLRLTRDPADDHEPAFSPDGTTIAFRSEREGGGIYIASALGGPARRIAPEGRRPQFSPDGNWIAYSVGIIGGATLNVPGKARIYVVASVGGVPRQVQPDFVAAAYPTWSPDGEHLLFLGNPENTNRPEESVDWWVTPLTAGPAIKTGALQATRNANLSGPTEV